MNRQLPSTNSASDYQSDTNKQSMGQSPLPKFEVEQPDPAYHKSLPKWMKDLASLALFVIIVIVGATLINDFVFQSFDVVGPSMEPTLEGEGSSDRLIVNRMPVTAAHLSGKDYQPDRGTIIVFKNPQYDESYTGADRYIVKRVIGLPGERVTVNDCKLLVHNSQHPDGFNPYETFTTLASNDSSINTCVDGDGTDVTVPKGEIFVGGDHRVGNYSMDSRNGGGRTSLGTIPLSDIVGPVSIRVWPLNNIKSF